MATSFARVVLLTALTLASGSTAFAQNQSLLGQWVITGAVVAPWADPLQRGGAEEERRLVGRTVTFGLHSVAGPSPLGCAHAVFRRHADTPDLLFEGGLAEPDAQGRLRNAAVLAKSLGMKTPTVMTIETSCSEVAYHQFARDTLVFGLNNRIYTLHPAAAATRP